ncbi:MAG: LemA family protein [Pseudobutyrivibrio ruminis]|nr:LemA family protein [Pseudobutyrivibrio ruminis]
MGADFERRSIMTGLIIVGVIVLVVVIIAIWFVKVSNNFKRLGTTVEQTKADIEVYMIKRYDVLMNSMKTAKEFASHEEDVFSKLVEIRKGMDFNKLSEQAALQEEASRSIFALAEAYPELKSTELFANLQVQLSDENEHYAAAKRSYNSNVSRFNKEVVVFPNSIVASMTGVKELPFFKDEKAEEKKEVSLDF